MKTLRLLASTLLLLALSGCSMTVFESLPTGETTRCDPAWPGHWAQVKSMSGKASEGSPEVIEIDATCSKSGKPGDTEPAPLLLVTTPDGRQYIDFMNEDGSQRCKPGAKDDAKDGKKCGHMLLRYEHVGDEIRVYEVDHGKAAALIRGKKIRGETEQLALPEESDPKKDKPEPVYFNIVAGDARRVDKVLRDTPELFASEPLMVMRRATPEEIAAEAARQAAKEAQEAEETAAEGDAGEP